MTRVNALQCKIHSYETRREKLRESLGAGRYNPGTGQGWMGHPEYAKKVSRINKSIKNFYASIRFLEAQYAIIKPFDIQVSDFFGVQRFKSCLKNGKFSRVKHLDRIARAMFYKIVIEEAGVRPYIVSHYVGAKYKKAASDTRMRLTRRFASNPDLKATYKTLSAFCKEVSVAEIKEQFLGIKDIHLEAA